MKKILDSSQLSVSVFVHKLVVRKDILFVYKIQLELFQGIIGMELHLSSFEMRARNGSRKGKLIDAKSYLFFYLFFYV